MRKPRPLRYGALSRDAHHTVCFCHVRAIRRFTVRTVLPEQLAPLAELVTNLRWSWDPETRDLFERIDAKVWEDVHHDPVRLLGEVPGERWLELAKDAEFLNALSQATESLRVYLTQPRWYQEQADAPAAIAYFSPEFGVTNALPQYSGGLGILAGDHLKSASDLGVPLIGVGLFYRAGYFRQSLSADGWQLEQYPLLDPDNMPLTLLRDAGGKPAVVTVGLPGHRQLSARVWVAHVGRVPLLMLDSDVESNGAAERDVTDRLYGGGSEHRLQQEMLLGIGGVRAVRKYCEITGHVAPEVFHTNEGHAGFLGLERMRELIEGSAGLTWDQAIQAVRAGTVFTTHTPVPAGIDRFSRDLVQIYLGNDNACIGLPIERVLELGAENFEGGDPTVFNMAVMGFRLGQRANGVSVLHGEVSRGMFEGLWEGFDQADVPIGSITNGVHAHTWVAREVRDLLWKHGGYIDTKEGWLAAEKIGDEELWQTKQQLRENLVADVRKRLKKSWLQRGAADAELGWINNVLDPQILTIGFARRVPSYKRLTLMLRDPDRLRALLLDPERPVQLVIAGKSHPADDGGKRLIQELVRFADSEDVRHRIVFLPNYDIALAQPLYPGCDVWLNNPLRPLEACGTSGMKAALNGALNLSILDGWWDEWFDGVNGWAIPTADGVDDADRRDEIESKALYDLIAGPVAHTFYDNDPASGLPSRWIGQVRQTLTGLGQRVLASRMVQDYVNELYTPAAWAQRAVSANDWARAKELAVFKLAVTQAWPQVRVEHVESHGVGEAPELGQTITVRAFVALGDIRPEDVSVQILHGKVTPDDQIVAPIKASLVLAEKYEAGRFRYEGQVPLDRTGPFGYSVRVVPNHPGLCSDAELGLIASVN
jgi:glycogen phosphorylase